MNVQTVKISNITIGERRRKDLGSISELASSISAVGMLQPIGVTPDLMLIWGERRLKACQQLGMKEINAVVDPSMADVIRAAQAEQAENSFRKEFTPTEALAIARHVEKIEREAAANRKREHANTAPGRNKNTSADSAEVISKSKHETRAKVAALVGMSHDKLSKIKAVSDSGTPELIEAMDKGEISAYAAADLATLPKDQQVATLRAGSDTIEQTSGNIRKMRKAATDGQLSDAEAQKMRSRGKGIELAYEAINILKRIPPNDPLRAEGIDTVVRWCRHNK